jgi:hypothetical protein
VGGPDRIDGVDSAARSLWCQENRAQWIVVGLQRGDDS